MRWVAERSNSNPEPFGARMLKDVLNEKSDTLEEELLELLVKLGL